MITTRTAPVIRSDQPAARPVAVPTIWRHALVAGGIAAAATLAIALIADTAGVNFAESSGQRIPIAGFPELTMFFALIGLALAARLARRARHPHSTFVRTTVALTALSVVPDLTFGFDGGSAAVLMLSHVVAAAIIIPTLASRLRR